jgi:predicted outer membrane repeat protein
MSDDVISGNTSEKDGGGIAIGGGAAVTLERCELSANISNNATTSPGGGGAIIISDSTLTLTNTTVSGNQAKKDGGGIMTLYGNPQVAITASTITANTPDRDGAEGGSGGGLHVWAGTVTLVGSIIAGNDGTQCVRSSGTLNSSGYNLASDASCELDGPGDLPSTPPKLGPLTDNSGVNLTHALLPGSPAIDAGDASYCPSTDQRGFARPMGAECDIGAYEAPVWVFMPLLMRQFP